MSMVRALADTMGRTSGPAEVKEGVRVCLDLSTGTSVDLGAAVPKTVLP